MLDSCATPIPLRLPKIMARTQRAGSNVEIDVPSAQLWSSDIHYDYQPQMKSPHQVDKKSKHATFNRKGYPVTLSIKMTHLEIINF